MKILSATEAAQAERCVTTSVMAAAPFAASWALPPLAAREVVQPDRGERQLTRLQEILAVIEPEGRVPLAQVLREAEMMTQPWKLYLTEDFNEAARAFVEKRPAGPYQAR